MTVTLKHEKRIQEGNYKKVKKGQTRLSDMCIKLAKTVKKKHTKETKRKKKKNCEIKVTS